MKGQIEESNMKKIEIVNKKKDLGGQWDCDAILALNGDSGKS